LLFDWFSNRKKAEWKAVSLRFFSCWFVLFLVGAALSVMQTLPKKDNSLMQPHLSLLADTGRMKVVLSKIAEAYLPIPEIRSLPYWEVSLRDRKSTRLNSSHVKISYAVFCLKKK